MFPGSTIYQHAELCRVPHDVLNNKVDAVFLDAEMEKMSSLDLMQKLHRQKPELPVFIISKSNDFCEMAAAAGANGYFVLPDSKQQLVETIRLVMNKENAS
jgi:DNA-binding NarL/FixJ family response regulator